MGYLTEELKTKKAVSYIRVSTRNQAERGGENIEGFSLPAQREANKRKASDLGAFVVKEFADRGQSAKSADRPQLQAMLKYVEAHKGRIDYLIVHKVDRLARNRGDDVEINRILKEAGVQLVSTSENIDSSPSGRLLHGIMSDIAEFYSNNLASEVMKGLTEKAKRGGTVGRAPIGYKNVVVFDERSRENRTVIVDEERAPLIRLAFELYATGDWNIRTLAEHLANQGLNMPPKAKLPGKLMDKRLLSGVLKNPYYKGLIRWNGAYWPGAHPALVSEDLWDKVQGVLATNRNGERSRKHEHFLKSTVYCGECGGRLIIHKATSRSGTIYPYFVCSNKVRKANQCKHKATLIDDAEQSIISLYDKITISNQQKEQLKQWMDIYIDKSSKQHAAEHLNLKKQKEKLERQQLKLLDAHYEDAIPIDLFKQEQEKLNSSLIGIDNQLKMHTDYFQHAKDNYEKILEVIENCNRVYATAPDTIKRMLNQAIFQKILVFSTGNLDYEADESFDAVLRIKTQTIKKEDSASSSGVLRSIPAFFVNFFDAGSNKPIMVGKTGFEPATPWSQTKCSTKLSYFPINKKTTRPRGVEPLTF
jgi:site-specific DNA recombinase